MLLVSFPSTLEQRYFQNLFCIDLCVDTFLRQMYAFQVCAGDIGADVMAQMSLALRKYLQ